jgi:DNA-binding CsgD family transcriptional regulator
MRLMPPETVAPPAPADDSNRRLAEAAEMMRGARGRARQVTRVFDRSMIPMVMVDNDRGYIQANRAARLLFRMSLAEMRSRRIEDFTPREHLPTLAVLWQQLMDRSWVATRYPVRFADGSRLEIDVCALANVLPGQHLIVFAPAGWPEDEIGQVLDGSSEALAGPLSPREREVLSLVATGADLQQVADELTISLATVRTHIGKAHRKLGARNRAHAVALAIQNGLIEPPDGGCGFSTSSI